MKNKLYILLLLLSGISACKKDGDPVEMIQGKWRMDDFYDYNGNKVTDNGLLPGLGGSYKYLSFEMQFEACAANESECKATRYSIYTYVGDSTSTYEEAITYQLNGNTGITIDSFDFVIDKLTNDRLEIRPADVSASASLRTYNKM